MSGSTNDDHGNRADPDHRTEHVELGMTRSDRRVVLVGFPVAGIVLGLLLPAVWDLLDGAEWIPFRGPLETLVGLEGGWQTVARVAVLAVVGLALAGLTVADEPQLSVGPDDITVRRPGSPPRVIGREEVAGVFLDQGRLIIETPQGRRLLDASVDGARRRAPAAFTRFGYPWEGR